MDILEKEKPIPHLIGRTEMMELLEKLDDALWGLEPGGAPPDERLEAKKMLINDFVDEQIKQKNRYKQIFKQRRIDTSRYSNRIGFYIFYA